MQYLCGNKKCLKIEIWSSFLKGSIDWKVLISFSVCIWIILVITSPSALSQKLQLLQAVGQGEGQGWAPTAAAAILSLWGFGAGPRAPSAWLAARCWIPTPLLMLVVQPWFMGVLASFWTSPSSPSQTLAPLCTCWDLHSRSKFRKSWLSPQSPVATDIFQRLQVKHSTPKKLFLSEQMGTKLFSFVFQLLFCATAWT